MRFIVSNLTLKDNSTIIIHLQDHQQTLLYGTIQRGLYKEIQNSPPWDTKHKYQVELID